MPHLGNLHGEYRGDLRGKLPFSCELSHLYGNVEGDAHRKVSNLRWRTMVSWRICSLLCRLPQYSPWRLLKWGIFCLHPFNFTLLPANLSLRMQPCLVFQLNNSTDAVSCPAMIMCHSDCDVSSMSKKAKWQKHFVTKLIKCYLNRSKFSSLNYCYSLAVLDKRIMLLIIKRGLLELTGKAWFSSLLVFLARFSLTLKVHRVSEEILDNSACRQHLK